MLLEVDNVWTGYGKTPVHEGVSIAVESGEIVALLGPNGAGKSTLLMAIAGLIRLKRGRILYAGREISGLSADRVASVGIALVPEGRRVFGALSVRENLKIGAYVRRRVVEAADYERIYSLFPILEEKQNQLGRELSGGQQQMLAIGRGLMSRPTLMLLDEPSLGLSPKLILDLRAIVLGVRDEFATTVVLVEQNAELALSTANRAYLMRNAAIVESGAVDELRDSAALRDLYLGGTSSEGQRDDVG